MCVCVCVCESVCECVCVCVCVCVWLLGFDSAHAYCCCFVSDACHFVLHFHHIG